MMRMTWQYFFMAPKSLASCFLPSSSCHFLQYLVKAFFLDLYLSARSGEKTGRHWSLITPKGQRKNTVRSCSPSLAT